ncbi:MAG: hypothetical protein MPK62_00300 [Alphaproteobacteria bacterium]|nr:hypothetical protein [Alphaproteobacteria bacterium]MDA8029578.1 hypothetical protein [Alphaproteobacteria bacterium]
MTDKEYRARHLDRLATLVFILSMFVIIEIMFVLVFLNVIDTLNEQSERLLRQCEFIRQAGGDPAMVDEMADECMKGMDEHDRLFSITILVFISIIGTLPYIMVVEYNQYREEEKRDVAACRTGAGSE